MEKTKRKIYDHAIYLAGIDWSKEEYIPMYVELALLDDIDEELYKKIIYYGYYEIDLEVNG